MQETEARTPTSHEDLWWRSAITYQVYIRSFRDGDGDGVGDIAGIRERIPYLAALGVDAIWINPWYPSPMADAGYDVADYRDVEPLFGTLDDAAALIDEAHAAGLRVVLDIVPNHTSDQHPWFQEALAAAPGSPERARYIFRPGIGPDGSQPPNDWMSVFGGPAWTRATRPDGAPGEWYLHLFAPEQPDLDWTLPEVREEFLGILRFWFDRGVDGFRIDVAHGLVKAEGLPDDGPDDPRMLEHDSGVDHPFWDLDGVHEIYRGWREVADSYDPPRTFIAEAWIDTPERLGRYLRPDELHTAFSFDFLRAPWSAGHLRRVIDSTCAMCEAVGAPPAWALANHDVAREVSRYARPQRDDNPVHQLQELLQIDRVPDLELGARRARAAALLMLALPGGAYIYQGEELGLPEVEDLPPELLQDPVWERSGRTDPGRDGCRVPIPWEATAPGFGFALAPGAAAPWLPQPQSWRALAADSQASDPASMLQLYRSALALRRSHPALGDGSSVRWIDARPDVLAFQRAPGFTCIVNLGEQPAPPPEGATLLLASSALESGGHVGSDGAAWYASGA